MRAAFPPSYVRSAEVSRALAWRYRFPEAKDKLLKRNLLLDFFTSLHALLCCSGLKTPPAEIMLLQINYLCSFPSHRSLFTELCVCAAATSRKNALCIPKERVYPSGHFWCAIAFAHVYRRRRALRTY